MEGIALTWSISVQKLHSTCSQVALRRRGIWAWPQGGCLCCAAFSSGCFVLAPQQSRGCGPTLSRHLAALTCTCTSCDRQQCCSSPRCLLLPPVGSRIPPIDLSTSSQISDTGQKAVLYTSGLFISLLCGGIARAGGVQLHIGCLVKCMLSSGTAWVSLVCNTCGPEQRAGR